MKIRNGFVSNSSSSSFICVGFKTEDENIFDKTNKTDYNIINDNIVGIRIGRTYDDFFEDEEFDFEEINKIKNDLIEYFGVNEDDVKIFVGTEGY